MSVFIRSKRYRGPVQAVILDWAGTGIDHGCFGPVRPIVDAFTSKGIELAITKARGPMGLAKKDHIRLLLESPEVVTQWKNVYGKTPEEADLDQIYLLAEKQMLTAVKDYALPIPGAVKTLQALKAMNIKVGSSTGYTSAMMEIVTKEAASHGYIVDSLVTNNDTYGKGRPYPFMIYENAIKLGVYPMEAIVKIGDTPVDIEEGLNAGVWTIGVTHSSSHVGLTKEELDCLPSAELAEKTSQAEKMLKEAGAHFVVPYLHDCLGVIEKINQNLKSGLIPVPAE